MITSPLLLVKLTLAASGSRVEDRKPLILMGVLDYIYMPLPLPVGGKK